MSEICRGRDMRGGRIRQGEARRCAMGEWLCVGLNNKGKCDGKIEAMEARKDPADGESTNLADDQPRCVGGCLAESGDWFVREKGTCRRPRGSEEKKFGAILGVEERKLFETENIIKGHYTGTTMDMTNVALLWGHGTRHGQGPPEQKRYSRWADEYGPGPEFRRRGGGTMARRRD